MPDVGVEVAPTDAPAAADASTPEPVPIPTDMGQLIAMMGPVFEEVIAAAVAKAIETTPVPVIRQGRCTGLDVAANIATVVIDGDTVAVSVLITNDLPNVDDRVSVQFDPSGVAYLYGVVGGTGVPPGSLIAYVGSITTDAIAAAPSSSTRLPPRGFVRCYGQILDRIQYPAGYWAFGTTFNTGGEAFDEFRAPDLRGRTFIGLDNMGGVDAARLSLANVIGTTGGAETSTALLAHTHDMQNHTHSGSGLTVASHTHDLANHTHTVNSHSHGGSTGSTNIDHQHDTQMPRGTTGSYGLLDNGAASANGTWAVGVAGGSHTHSINGDTPGTSGPSNNTSGSASPGVSGNTGTPSNNTTTSAGAGSSFSLLNPTMVGHWLIRV